MGSAAERQPAGRGSSSWPLGSPGRRELALFAAVYGLYDAGRWMFAGRPPVARAHADWVTHLERSLHVAVEGSVQRALDWGVASFLLSNIYLAAQLVVLPGALIWLYRRSPDIYRRLRNTVATTWVISTPVFALYPVAPPRLAGLGLNDTVSHQAAVSLTGNSTIFYNPYAAVPSLHVGLAFAIAIAPATRVAVPLGQSAGAATVTSGPHDSERRAARRSVPRALCPHRRASSRRPGLPSGHDLTQLA